jgi:dihydrolipoamide dehydrogenase
MYLDCLVKKMKEYDLIVVGSGVGLTVLNTGLQQGWKCALIEDAKVGGTCLTRGCIPSKVLIYPADLIRAAELGKKVGLHFKLEKIDWKVIADRMWSQINESQEMERGLKTVKSLDFYQGVAEFVDKYQLKVKLNTTGKYTDVFKGKRIVLASGARSWIPPIEGIDKVHYVTSETFFGPDFPQNKPWDSMIMVGGGVIAAEFAHFFSAMGTKVTIVEMLPRLLTSEEFEVSELVETAFKERMTVLTNTKAIKVREEHGEKILTVEDTKTHKMTDLRAQVLFISAGRKSNADLLQVQKSGIKTDAKGWIQTNAFLETNIPNIWAIGDATGQFQFRHKANYDAEICAQNLLSPPDERIPVDYTAVPWAVFTEPQVGHVGMTQEEAIAKGHKIYVAVKRYSSVAKGFAMGIEPESPQDGLVKLVVDQSYRILGAHIVGPEAALLVQPFVYLMNSGFTCGHPTPGDVESFARINRACPEGGSFMPIYRSMVIHPSLNEVTGWAIGNLRPINIAHSHSHEHAD